MSNEMMTKCVSTNTLTFSKNGWYGKRITHCHFYLGYFCHVSTPHRRIATHDIDGAYKHYHATSVFNQRLPCRWDENQTLIIYRNIKRKNNIFTLIKNNIKLFRFVSFYKNKILILRFFYWFCVGRFNTYGCDQPCVDINDSCITLG